MRHYYFLAVRPGGFQNWPGDQIQSPHRIRAVAVGMFRKWYGREPNSSWGKDGFMAEARDERGNEIQIFQDNWLRDDTLGKTLMSSPTCPMVRAKEAA